MNTILSVLCFAVLSTMESPAVALHDADNAVAGGLDYADTLEWARSFADALLDAAPDRYGKRETPLWIGVIDPETRRLIEEKPENFMIYWDAEDYVMTAQGCNLYRDLPALRGLYTLSELTGEDKYRQAAEAYLDFFLEECPSETTGLLPAGEHMSYNCVRDRINAKRHEMEHNLPDWNLLWSINPRAVRRAIEAIYEYHIYDKENFFYDRHGAYYTGEFDPMPVRGTYIKHSGLYAYSFLFLYSKTREEKHLEWAHGMADLYWRHRNPDTNLVPGYVSPGGAQSTTQTQLLLAYYLLEAASIEPDPFFIERGIGMLDSYLQYGYDPDTASFAQSLDITTGNLAQPSAGTPWTAGERACFYEPLVLWKAYEIAGARKYLDVMAAILARVDKAPISPETEPYTAGQWLGLYLDAYRATGDRTFLHRARSLAQWSKTHLVKNGLILERANGLVYHNYSRPGGLFAAWLRLYEIEQEEPFHWRTANALSTHEDSVPIEIQGRNLRVVWHFQDGASGEEAADAPSVRQVSIPMPSKPAQGPLRITFQTPDGSQDTAEILLAENPEGPVFSGWEHAAWIAQGEPLEGRVEVRDPSGVVRVECVVATEAGAETRLPCTPDPSRESAYVFSIPPATRDLVFAIEAAGNPAWPIVRRSPARRVILAKTAQHEGTSWIHASAPWMGTAGLPPAILSDFVRITEGQGEITLAYDAAKALEAWTPSIAVYTFSGGQWQRDDSSEVDTAEEQVRFTAKADGLYVVAAEARLVWRRSFNGALLDSPALIRTDASGGAAIILDTGKADGMFYALRPTGEPLWTYDVDDDQSFPTVADLDGDGVDEIALGAPRLTLLDAAGQVRWEAPLEDAASPVIGDLDGDGSLDVFAASIHGPLMALSSGGRILWQTEVPEGWRPLPALATLDEQPGLDVLYGKNETFHAFSGASGGLLWKTSVDGEILNAPAVADLDHDGRDEAVFFSRTDDHATLYALDHDGALLWSVPTNRNSDWSPVICDFDPSEGLEILAQEPDATQFGIYSRQGQRIRTITLPGRTLLTPVVADFNQDGKLDLLSAFDIAMQVRCYSNDGLLLWTYTPESRMMAGAKIKGSGSLLVADLDGDGWIEVAGGDDLTWFQVFKTDTPCAPGAVLSGQFHGDARHSGCYVSDN